MLRHHSTAWLIPSSLHLLRLFQNSITSGTLAPNMCMVHVTASWHGLGGWRFEGSCCQFSSLRIIGSLCRLCCTETLKRRLFDSPLLTTSFGQSLDDPQEIPIRHEWCVGFCRKWSSFEHQLFTVVYRKILPHSYRHTCRLGSISCTRPGGDRVASEWKRCFPRIWASNHVLSRGQENQGDVLTGLSELTCCETVCLK